MVKEFQDIVLNIFVLPPNAKYNSPGCRVIRILRLIFSARLLILTAIILSMTRCFSILIILGVHIQLTYLLAVMMLNYLLT